MKQIILSTVLAASGCGALDSENGSLSPDSLDETHRLEARILIGELGTTAPVLASVESSTACAQSPTQSDVTLDVLTVEVLWSPADQLKPYENTTLTVHALSPAHKQMTFGEPHYAAIYETRLDPALDVPCDVDGGYLLIDGLEKETFETIAQKSDVALRDAIEASYAEQGRPGPRESDDVSYAFLGDECCH